MRPGETPEPGTRRTVMTMSWAHAIDEAGLFTQSPRPRTASQYCKFTHLSDGRN